MSPKLMSSLAALVMVCSLLEGMESSFQKEGSGTDGKRQRSQENLQAHEPRKKLKAHFAGSKRPPQNAPDYKPVPKAKKSTHIKNPWVLSKTHPKVEQAGDTHNKADEISQPTSSFGEGKALISSRRSSSPRHIAQIGQDPSVPVSQAPLQEKQSFEEEYPQARFIAPHGHIYMTGEWLYWRTRLMGVEYAVERSSSSPGVFTDAVPKKLVPDWQSGFRVGLGVHLPYDRWDIYVNYTDFRPDTTSHARGSLFPLLVFQGQFPIGNVTQAQGSWNMDFQTLDIEIGKVYAIGKSLVLHPNVGMRGVWIDQNAHFTYRGGDIPLGQEYTVQAKNDFKGAGIRAGVNSNWQFGAGFSLRGDLFTSLIIGHFDLSQEQKQINGIPVIDLHTSVNQFSPNAQLFLGISWDRNFYQERCHLGVTFGFESQYWWRQYQMEHFTDSSLPIYVRPDEDLSLYGINLQARFDF